MLTQEVNLHPAEILAVRILIYSAEVHRSFRKNPGSYVPGSEQTAS